MLPWRCLTYASPCSVVGIHLSFRQALFQEKDYLHSRFFHKRAYYLSVIAATISDKSGMNVEVFFESPTGDPRLTTLILRPRNGKRSMSAFLCATTQIHQGDSETDFSGLNAEIRIIPVLSPSSPIPLQRLSPARSNIRTSDDASDTPTPLYNSAIALCTTYKRHFLGTHSLKESVPAFADALALLRVWANQRGYGAGDRLCVRGFERRGMFWVSVLELLVHGEESAAGGFGKAVKRKPLGKGLSSYQLFKAALDFLGAWPLLVNLTRHRLTAVQRDMISRRTECSSSRRMDTEYALPVLSTHTKTDCLER